MLSYRKRLRSSFHLMDTMPGGFRGEFELGYWGGVTGDADAWYVRFEADIRDGEIFVTARTPEDALRKARAEASERIPQG